MLKFIERFPKTAFASLGGFSLLLILWLSLPPKQMWVPFVSLIPGSLFLSHLHRQEQMALAEKTSILISGLELGFEVWQETQAIKRTLYQRRLKYEMLLRQLQAYEHDVQACGIYIMNWNIYYDDISVLRHKISLEKVHIEELIKEAKSLESLAKGYRE
jgi:hypothetical protein